MTSLLIVLAEVVHAYRSASWDMPASWTRQFLLPYWIRSPHYFSGIPHD
jgi:hypothetical protein